MPNRIDIRGGFIRKEGVTDEAITPGHLIELGGTNDVQKHSVPGGNAQKRFALANDLIGKGIDDAYASGETVQFGIFERGAEVYAVLADGESVTPGTPLESAGDGTLQEHTAIGSAVAVEAIVAYALETLAPSGSTARIKAEVA